MRMYTEYTIAVLRDYNGYSLRNQAYVLGIWLSVTSLVGKKRRIGSPDARRGF